jgi:hypothetical protein
MPGGDFHPSDQAHSRAHDRRRLGGMAREGRLADNTAIRVVGTSRAGPPGRRRSQRLLEFARTTTYYQSK